MTTPSTPPSPTRSTSPSDRTSRAALPPLPRRRRLRRAWPPPTRRSATRRARSRWSRAESMAIQYAHLVNSDTHDDLLIVELDGSIVGYARVEWREAIDGPRYLQTDLPARPDVPSARASAARCSRGRSAGCASIAATFPADPPCVMRAWTFDAERGPASSSATRLDPRGPRLRDGPARPSTTSRTVPLPDGFEIRPVGAGDARRVWDASAEAFRDERGEGEWSEADWERHIADPHRDPSLWAVAFVGDEVAGGVHGRIDPEENAHHGVRQGLHRGRLDATAVPPPRAGQGAPRPRARAAPRARHDERLSRGRRPQPEPGRDTSTSRSGSRSTRARPTGPSRSRARGRRGGRTMTTMTETTWLDLPGMPAIAGLRARRFRDAADYEAMAAVIARGQPPRRHRLACRPPSNLAVEMDGRGRHRPRRRTSSSSSSTAGRRRRPGLARGPRRTRSCSRSSGSVAPGRPPSRDRVGAARRRTCAAPPSAAALEPAGTDDPRSAAFVDEGETAHRALLERPGSRPIRHFFLMRRPDLDVRRRDAPLPDGLEIRPVTADQHGAIFDAEAEAFRDHWGNREWTDDDFRDDVRPRGARHEPVGGRLGRGRGRGRRPDLDLAGGERATRRASAAGSSTSASAGRGADAASRRAITADGHGPAPRGRHGRRDARRRLGEPDRRPRPLRGPRVRGLQPRDGVRARPAARPS